MKKTNLLAVTIAVASVLGMSAAKAQDDIYVAPYDESTTSDEDAKAQSNSGFDTSGPLAIPQSDYDSGVSSDGSTYTPSVPDVPEPVEVDE